MSLGIGRGKKIKRREVENFKSGLFFFFFINKTSILIILFTKKQRKGKCWQGRVCIIIVVVRLGKSYELIQLIDLTSLACVVAYFQHVHLSLLPVYHRRVHRSSSALPPLPFFPPLLRPPPLSFLFFPSSLMCVAHV